jgi:hypothetical protein
VIEIVGPISDVIIAEIIATGISKAELVTAHDRVVRDRAAHRPGPPLEPGHFARRATARPCPFLLKVSARPLCTKGSRGAMAPELSGSPCSRPYPPSGKGLTGVAVWGLCVTGAT